MAYEIIWSDEATQSFAQAVEYLEKNFSGNEILRFVTAVNNKIELIGLNPKMYRKSARFRNIHYTNILRKVLLVYRVQTRKNKVELIHFWDGRRNPKLFKI